VTKQRVQRRLAAILAADVVGYSALMQRAEEATYAEFERLKREVIEPGLSRGEVEGKLDVGFEGRGEQQLKNISKPVRAFAVRAGVHSALIGRLSAAPALPDKPSIAVLPFENMSGDPEQEYFADGVVEDIITALSQFSWLMVIARNSTFTYKNKATDVKQIGRELGVRYALEGSVRKAAGMVRITGQLIDCATGTHLWADRFDGSLENVFDLQDQVTMNVVGAIEPRLRKAEIERANRKPTENLGAYDYFLRGLSRFHLHTRQGNEDALKLFMKVVDLDPNYAAA
jgi:adenylate cyclase